MGSIDVIRSCLESIRQIGDDVADAIVYLDAGCVEAFQFVGAFSLLLELGARAVCSLESMSSLDVLANWNSTSMEPAKKMVVITSRLLSDAHRYILRCLGMHQTIVDCRIFTSISEVSHSAYIDSPLGPDAFHEYESLLQLDYEELVKKDRNKIDFNKINKLISSATVQEGNFCADADCWSPVDAIGECSSNSGASYTDSVEAEGSARLIICVHHFPMIYCALSPRVFILPSEGTIAEACLSDDHEDSLSPGLPAISTGHPPYGDDIPPGATLTAHFLYHLAAKMDLKMEIFSLGDLSKSIGKILTDMSSLYDVGRRNKRSAGLLIIDRSLDLLTPCCHGDAVVDWMVSSLPRRERTSPLHAKSSQLPNKPASTSVQRPSLDVKIPMGKIFGTGWSPAGGGEFSHSIAAFVSGWNSGGVGNDSVELNCHKDKDSPSSFVANESLLLSGSLVSCDSYKGVNYLEALLDRGIKDGVTLIKKWLLGVLHQDKVSANLKSRLSLPSSELLSMVKLLASNQMSFISNKGIIQLAAASIFALNEPCNSHWNAFVSAERILKMSTGDTSQSLSNQIRDLINASILLGSKQDTSSESSQGVISFEDSLLLAIIGYMLAGESFPTSVPSSPFSWEEEHSLKEAVVDAILEVPATKCLRFLHGLGEELEANFRKRKIEKQEATMETSNMEDLDDNWGSWEEDLDNDNEPAYGNVQLKLELRDRLDQLFKFFYRISSLKWRNPAFKNLESRFSSDSFSNKGLLFKLLLMVLSKSDVPGLEYHSSAVGRFLKSGFGRFGLGQAKPSLADQSILVVFVVGGINCLEVREAQEAILQSGRQDVELIIGGTTLLTPDNMFELLLGPSSYI